MLPCLPLAIAGRVMGQQLRVIVNAGQPVFITCQPAVAVLDLEN